MVDRPALHTGATQRGPNLPGSIVGGDTSGLTGQTPAGAGGRPIWPAAVTSHDWNTRRACTRPRLVRQPQLKDNSPLPM